MKTVFKMLCGQLVTSVGIAMVIASGFGAFPCTTCNMAFVNWSGLSYGIINMFPVPAAITGLVTDVPARHPRDNPT